MDAIEKLVERIEQRFQAKHNGWHIIEWIKDCIRAELRAANITIPPSPPEPGSLWEHKETGERRFVTHDCGSYISFTSLPTMTFSVKACCWRHSDWHAWSANARCLVPGKGA